MAEVAPGDHGGGVRIRGERGLRRDVGRIGLLFTSVGSIIGSGWLLGAQKAATKAGPAALVSWVIGGLAIILLALIIAELGGMYPLSGGVTRFPHYSFGSLVGFGVGWIYWLGSACIAPIEVEAALQYATNYIGGLTHTAGGTEVLTPLGYVVSAVLMLAFTVINIYGVRWLSKTNTPVVWWKIAIPVLTIIVFLIVSFHPSNFHTSGGFAPYGLKGIITATASSGVIFAYLGFEQAIQFGGETENPHRNIPWAVIGSILLGTVIYIALQVAFLGAVSPSSLARGWSNLSFAGHFGPFAGLATGLGLTWLAVLLYADAFVSPAGTGLVYVGSSSRAAYGMARNGYIPSIFGRVSDRGVPLESIILSFVVGMIIFLPFPGWQKLVAFITSATVMIYGSQCLALPALRRQQPELERPFRLPGASVLAPVGFAISNLLVLAAGWGSTNSKLFITIIAGYVILFVSYLFKSEADRPKLDWRASAWLWPWLAGLALISWQSSFEGTGNIPFGVDLVVTTVWSLVIFFVAQRLRLEPREVQERVDSSVVAARAEEAAPAPAATT